VRPPTAMHMKLTRMAQIVSYFDRMATVAIIYRFPTGFALHTGCVCSFGISTAPHTYQNWDTLCWKFGICILYMASGCVTDVTASHNYVQSQKYGAA